MASRISYPPCAVNPMTEKPYTRHKWHLVKDNAGLPILRIDPKTGATLYHVRCSRGACSVNDPAKVLH